MKHPKIATAVLTTAIIIVLAIVTGLVVMYSGLPNVAASKPEGPITSWMLGTTMDHSVRRHAADVSIDLARADLAEGAKRYDKMCAGCHGAPGREPAEGFNPPPPELREAAGDWKAEEIYWIVDNGIKMTAMPTFGKKLSVEQMTSITAFTIKLPTMTAQEYQQLAHAESAASQPASAQAHDHHD